MPDSNIEVYEGIVEAAIRDAICATDPDLYAIFLQGLLRDPGFRAGDPAGTPVSPVPAGAILSELCFLLRTPILQRSIPQRRILTGLVVARLLGRTQWTNTAGIRIFFLKGLKAPNIAMHVHNLRRNLGECIDAPRATQVRIEISGSEGGHSGYQPMFHDVNSIALSEISADLPSAEICIRVLKGRAYNRHLARAIARGVPVNIFTRTGQFVLDDDASWSIIADSVERASLSISLLDPANVADAKERDVIERNANRLLERRARLTNPLISVTMSFHTDGAKGLEVTQVGEVILAGYTKRGGHESWEIRPSCLMFSLFQQLLAFTTRDIRPLIPAQVQAEPNSVS